MALLVVVLGPIALRPKSAVVTRAGERVLVIITPHNEAIRAEFGRAFREHYLAKTGQRVQLDFRTPGGTSEITRYIAGEYIAAFKNYWEGTLGRTWNRTVETNFANSKVRDDSPADHPSRRKRGKRFSLRSPCKLDLFFGGGAYDFQSQAAARLPRR